MGLLHGAAAFNRLLQSTAADQAAPGPALPLSPQAAPAGDRPSGERDPIVRTRPERYGRAIAPDELPGQEAPPPVPVKAHVRSAPGTAAAAPAAEKPPVTLDAIVEQYRRTLRYTTRRHIYMGGLVDSWLRKQPERQEQLPRAAAMIVIEQRFASEKLDAAECRPHRDLKCYHAARLLGGDGESVVWSALRHVLKLVERRDYDHWQLRPASADTRPGTVGPHASRRHDGRPGEGRGRSDSAAQGRPIVQGVMESAGGHRAQDRAAAFGGGTGRGPPRGAAAPETGQIGPAAVGRGLISDRKAPRGFQFAFCNLQSLLSLVDLRVSGPEKCDTAVSGP